MGAVASPSPSLDAIGCPLARYLYFFPGLSEWVFCRYVHGRGGGPTRKKLEWKAIIFTIPSGTQ